MKLFKNQKGFGAVEAVLILVIIGLIGGIGYYVYKANKEDIKVSDSSIQKKPQITEDQKDYLVIKELSMKADKSAIPGVYYKMVVEERIYPDFPEIKSFNLYDKAYDDTVNADGMKCSDVALAPVGSIDFIKESDRDAKYSKYKNEKNITLEVPAVLSDQYNTKKEGFLLSYYNMQGVQAPPDCVGDDYAIKKSGNKKVMEQLKKSRAGLEKLVDSFVKE